MKIYHFIGSIYFTLILIPLTALFVVTGTLLESISDSHSYAAHFTYDNPLFSLLLSFFFANILISALRRWPFKRRHIPFLLTHLGLLMVIAGVMVKTQYGIQGALVIWEGSASSEVLSSKQNSIVVRNRSGQQALLPIKLGAAINLNGEKWKIVKTSPHSEEKIASWIVDDELRILGLQPMHLTESSLGAIRVHSSTSNPWEIYGGKTEDPAAWIKQHWMRHAKIQLIERSDKTMLYEGVASEAPSLRLDEIEGTYRLVWEYPPFHVELPLMEGASLENKVTPYLGTSPIEIVINYPQSFCFLKSNDQTVLYAIDKCGAIESRSPDTWVTYNNGFGGHFSQLTVPFGAEPRRVPTTAENLRETLAQVEDSTILSPPLQLLGDHPKILVEFLEKWDRTHEWFYPAAGAAVLDFPLLNWSGELYKAAYWTIQIVSPLIEGLKKGKDLIALLHEKQWPLIDELTQTHQLENSVPIEKIESVLRHLSQQIFLIATHLPEPPPFSQGMNQQLYSAYLRTYGIHLTTLSSPTTLEKLENLPKLESPITHQISASEPLKKWEDNRPLAVLSNGHEEVALSYDPSGKKISATNEKGTALFNYQPTPIAIPYRVHVHKATQTNYANSTQPHSYECTVFINEEKVLLSMNKVHETWDGFRFYLASIYPENPGQVHQVRIVVNHDPAKYWLTYPGCLILVLGIGLLSGFLWGRKN